MIVKELIKINKNWSNKMRQEVINIYKFDELDSEAQQRAIENCRYWDVEDGSCYEYILEDASSLGIDILEFDVTKNLIKVTVSPLDTIAETIEQEYDEDSELYVLVKNWRQDYNNDVFLEDLKAYFLNMLSDEYQYLISDGSVVDTIIANEIEFLKTGKVY